MTLTLCFISFSVFQIVILMASGTTADATTPPRSPRTLGEMLTSTAGPTVDLSASPRAATNNETPTTSTDVSADTIPVYVVPGGGSRRGAAIFANWSDCEFYLQDQVDLTYRRFVDMEAAVKYFHPLIASQSMKRPRSTSTSIPPSEVGGSSSPPGTLNFLFHIYFVLSDSCFQKTTSD